MKEKPTYSPGYERREMGASFVGLLASALIVFAVVAHGVSSCMYSRWQAQQQAGKPPPHSYVQVDPISREPRLQRSPSQDLKEMQAEEHRLLNSYGWVDRSKGILRLPIEDAMRIVAERGLPVRPAATQESAHEK